MVAVACWSSCSDHEGEQRHLRYLGVSLARITLHWEGHDCYSSSVRVITVCQDFAEMLTDIGHQKSVITPCLERVKDLKRGPDPFSNATI